MQRIVLSPHGYRATAVFIFAAPTGGVAINMNELYARGITATCQQAIEVGLVEALGTDTHDMNSGHQSAMLLR